MKKTIEEIIEELKRQQITLASAESLTGGLFASTVTNYSGVSAIFKGGVVSYANEVKESVLGVHQDTIASVGVVSADVAKEMAEGVAKLLGVEMSVSFTGNAGPNGMEGKPVGLVYIGICYKGITLTFENHFSGSRNEIRKKCVEKAFDEIAELIF